MLLSRLYNYYATRKNINNCCCVFIIQFYFCVIMKSVFKANNKVDNFAI